MNLIKLLYMFNYSILVWDEINDMGFNFCVSCFIVGK